MIQLLFLFFLTIPIIEIYLLLKIGGLIGVMPTVILVVTTALLGAAMLRNQGFQTMQRLQEAMNRGEIPAMEIVEGPLLLAGGALLLTPGFFTDLMGFYLLIPPTRKRFARYLLQNRIFQGIYTTASQNAETESGKTIEGEYRRND